MIFTEKDIEQIKTNELTLEKVRAQIALIKAGMPYSNLVEAASVGNGILAIEASKEQDYIDRYENARDALSIVKFVPASGLATRMFKFLFRFLNEYDAEKESINAYINRNKDNDLKIFLVGLEKLPFFEEVVHKLHEVVPNFNELSYDEKRVEFVKTMLDEDRLNYSFFPKGLLPFHRYKKHVSTAFEEHLFEAALYASSGNKVKLHFTISERHNHRFGEEFRYIEEDVEEQTKTKFNISFSYQKKSTETIALTSENKIFRKVNGSLVFRPSGHGALIENLNDLEGDLIFIKNIDNVVVSKQKEKVSYYKKVLAGILLEIQAQAFKYLYQLDQGQIPDKEQQGIVDFLSKKLSVVVTPDFNKYTQAFKIEYLKEKLNRPIRVCGMVKNEGEPGGGPFWVNNGSGDVSLQIVESAQIDTKNKQHKEIARSATHFNPVDLVCGVKNYKGEPFDLTKFVDNKAAFITEKNQNGVDIKALELPGLWNGSMAYWNSIFVEVPLLTFNPVKTVNDLLKIPHQVSYD
ncbi:DUF4301 family protein [Snuella sedimenti]|uniref:DUF4301 family protein n=1 Tax=Snuella sedimenti TaxID=2798802 RepID=A0A8J7LUH7_9FLAO|nr:DUF4301 family protein [Snuella sedimenti]MBJ6369666.1 DUF4301 family protein [Snuella sedimenti]